MDEPEEQQATLAAPMSDAPAPRPMLGAPQTVAPDRYEPRGEIGRGGMGTVEAWRDPHIGREVAAKILLDASPGYRDRFLHEARTQGSLGHPAIVPVHDLAYLPDGRPFFTMQRVHGVTLAAILAGRSMGNELAQRFSDRKLLEALARIALAVDFAHQRDVVHRDLKPANLMLGDYGEVYVLDWGIARRGANAIGHDEGPPSSVPMPEAPGVTVKGALLGTPGYMSPEQARGDGAEVDGRSDVYALGCVLFEILAGTPLHRGERATDLMVSTLTESIERSPARRSRRDVAPELDALCLAATEHDGAARLRSPRELAQGIERFLEGDRDQAARAAAAQEHAARARQLADVALGDSAGDGATQTPEQARRQALYEVGRAIALAPEHPVATATLVALLTEPPVALPTEVREELDDLTSEHVRVGGRVGAVAYGVASVVFAVLLALGVVQWATGAWLPVVLFGVAAATSFAFSRVARPTTRHSLVMLVLSTAAITSLSTIFSPFFGVPTAVCVNTMLFVLSNERRLRGAMVPIGAAGVLLPFLGEAIGLTPPSFRLEGGNIVLLPRFMTFTETSVVVLVISFVLTTVIAALALGPFRDDLDHEQRRSRLLSWQLRQFVPGATRVSDSERPARRR